MSNLGPIRIGTRKSKLAVWQAQFVAELLQSEGHQTELVPIDTKGDKILDVTIAKIGSKGVFTEEIEERLISREIDIAVHSAKDLQSQLPHPFEIIAFTKRELSNDVLISTNSKIKLEYDSSFKIGTSSTRRIATLKRHFPKIKTVDVRGNLQTRLEKLKSGLCDALVLAYAGVHRMNFNNYICQHLDKTVFTPPAGQGSIAVEILKTTDIGVKDSLKKALNDVETEYCLLAERSFLKVMNGGCSIPVFVHSEMEHDRIHINGGILSLDGQKEVRSKKEAPKDSAMDLGKELALEILEEGGREILKEIRNEK